MSVIAGKRILVVEDEFLIAQTLVDAIQSEGAIAVGPAATIERANALLDDEQIDAAIIDLNLRGHSNAAMTEKLRRRHIPFAIVTGYAHEEQQLGAPVLSKPFQPEQVVDTLLALLSSTSS
jgi:DNA-binding response OmpR family regulator